MKLVARQCLGNQAFGEFNWQRASDVIGERGDYYVGLHRRMLGPERTGTVEYIVLSDQLIDNRFRNVAKGHLP